MHQNTFARTLLPRSSREGQKGKRKGEDIRYGKKWEDDGGKRMVKKEEILPQIEIVGNLPLSNTGAGTEVRQVLVLSMYHGVTSPRSTHGRSLSHHNATVQVVYNAKPPTLQHLIVSTAENRRWFPPRLMYAASAWRGLASTSDRQRIDSVIDRARRNGYCATDLPSFDELCDDADDELFNKAVRLPNHVLHSPLPPPSSASQRYNLRNRAHL